MTRDEARDMLVQSIENEATHDAAVKLREINQRLKDESEQTAREIISTAIQRCAADQVSEATVSVVPLPNDEMKGRIIGREGRNIPHAGNPYRRRPHHRRYARSYHSVLVRSGSP